MNRRHPRVLIVEDEEMVAHMFSKLFEMWFWEAIKALDGTAAIKRLDETPFDLILLDVMLPDIDGVEVLREIRARKLACPVVISTALPLDVLGETLKLAPEHVFLKPINFDQIKDVAQKIYDAFVPTEAPILVVNPEVLPS